MARSRRLLHRVTDRLLGLESASQDATIRALHRYRRMRAQEAIEVADDGSRDKYRIDMERLRTEGAPRQLRHPDLKALQREFQHLYHIAPVVRSAIQISASLSAAHAPKVEISNDRAAARWAEIAEKTDYFGRWPKLWRDMLLYGEMLTTWVRAGKDGMYSTKGEVVELRILDPISPGGLRKPRTDPMDVERVLSYMRIGTFREIPGENATHWRVSAPGNEISGRPLLEPAWDDIQQLRQFEFEMYVMRQTRLRNSAWVIKFDDEEDEEDDREEEILSLPAPEPNSAWFVPKSMDVERPPLRDLLVSGQRYDDTPTSQAYRGIGMAAGVPVHMLTQEFDAPTFAASLSAEAPATLIGQDRAAQAVPFVEHDVRVAIGDVEAKAVDIQVTVPPVIFRDLSETRESVLLLYEAGLLDRQTAREELGYDHREIERRLGNRQDDPNEPVDPTDQEAVAKALETIMESEPAGTKEH